MNQTATQPLTTLELATDTQVSTNIPFFSVLPPLETSTPPTFTELFAEYQASVSKPAQHTLIRDQLANPSAISQTNLAQIHPQPVRWLWQKRVPLSGITLLDSDHGCGKSLLSLQIAACVSSSAPMPDGTSTLQGGVVIVTPNSDITTTQLLTALGADLSRIEILSSLQEPVPSSHTKDSRPFSIPEDFTHLSQAIHRVDARLVIFDPFISLLSRKSRCTDQSLGNLLADLKLYLIKHNIACLLIRNCHAKGGHARPSVLERSDHFENLATSRLLLAPHPLQPDRLLLSHATNRHRKLTPTLTLQIRALPSNPDLPHMTILGSHSLQAKDLINHRPDILHRQLLSQHLLQIITATTDPIHIASLYAHCPYSSPFQIQRSLRDLRNLGQIERGARGSYAPTPTPSIPSFKPSAATATNSQPLNQLKPSAATATNSQPLNQLKSSAAITPNSQPLNQLKPSAATATNSQPANQLKPSAAITTNSQPANQLKSSAAITPNSQPLNQLKPSAATTPNTEPSNQLKPSAAITPNTEPSNQLKPSAATTPNSQPLNQLKPSAATITNSQPSNQLKSSAATTTNSQPLNQLKSSAATTTNSQPSNQLKSSAAITPNSQPVNQLKSSAATATNSQPSNQLKSSAATATNSQPSNQLKSSAAITPKSQLVNKLKPSATTIPNSKPTNQLESSDTTNAKPKTVNQLKSSAAITPNSQLSNQLKSSAANNP